MKMKKLIFNTESRKFNFHQLRFFSSFDDNFNICLKYVVVVVVVVALDSKTVTDSYGLKNRNDATMETGHHAVLRLSVKVVIGRQLEDFVASTDLAQHLA